MMNVPSTIASKRFQRIDISIQPSLVERGIERIYAHKQSLPIHNDQLDQGNCDGQDQETSILTLSRDHEKNLKVLANSVETRLRGIRQPLFFHHKEHL
jgi:hypothetical protein